MPDTKANKIAFALPVIILLVLAAFFTSRLVLIERGDAPDKIPSVMLNRQAPPFSLPSLMANNPDINLESYRGHVVLVNFFASWCEACRADHALLPQAKQAGIYLVGIDYKDKDNAAQQWLLKLGNPFDVVATDHLGTTAVDFGVYGVPESYLIDKQGYIRFKQTGPLTQEDIDQTIIPLARKLAQ